MVLKNFRTKFVGIFQKVFFFFLRFLNDFFFKFLSIFFRNKTIITIALMSKLKILRGSLTDVEMMWTLNGYFVVGWLRCCGVVCTLDSGLVYRRLVVVVLFSCCLLNCSLRWLAVLAALPSGFRKALAVLTQGFQDDGGQEPPLGLPQAEELLLPLVGLPQQRRLVGNVECHCHCFGLGDPFVFSFLFGIAQLPTIWWLNDFLLGSEAQWIFI